MTSADYTQIVTHYEQCLALHGDTHRGVDWPNQADALKRYEVMLGVIRPGEDRPVSLLDFGCGTAHLLDYLIASARTNIDYLGLDLSAKFVAVARTKHPGRNFLCSDVLLDESPLPEVDYIVMNGVFTEKRRLSFEEMFDYMRKLVHRVFPAARRGIAFNVMSKHVDWERDDLFHVPYDVLAAFLKTEISRHFVFRADYGLYEYTTYLYREPLNGLNVE
jgi:SAM-dependent methyltransferase